MEWKTELLATNNMPLLQAEQYAWLRAFADKLCDNASKPNGQCGYYQNNDGFDGFYICYKYFGPMSDRYLMISRSHTNLALTKDQIVNDLRSPEVEIRSEWCGKYHEYLQVPGAYASVRLGSFWYMLSESGIPEPFEKWRFSKLREYSGRSAGCFTSRF